MYLEKINSPEELKKLDLKKLKILSAEIRKFLIESVSKNGGHLASNLGAVELTIALHYCFNAPKDKIIWDVGHQAYTHKILTGRREGFSSLRNMDGISGFPRPTESVYDCFTVGHSSTSIAAAIGMAKARDLKGDDYNIVSVIGDGAMTGGLAFEALNNVGRNKTKLIIILNDNQMSISENVGGLSRYLNELRTGEKYLDAKDDIQKRLDKLPVVGEPLKNFLANTKDSVKRTIMHVNIFEAFGLRYFGPVDGNDLQGLIKIFRSVKKINDPVLIHIITKKGKGYKPAEEHPSEYHGVSAFDPHRGIDLNKPKTVRTYSDVFGAKLLRIASKNKKVCAITAAMPSGTGLDSFAKTYPDRFIDVGIAEEFAVTVSSGLAKGGFIPVFAVYSTFLQRAYDQILHDVCIQKAHVVFAIDRAGIVGRDGETHQGIFDISYLAHIPNLVVMAPKNKWELEDMLDFAIEYDGPVAIRYPRGKAAEILKADRVPVELGKSEVIYSGSRIAIVSYGAMVEEALRVYTRLISKGEEPTVINARFASPLDEDMIASLCNDYEYVFTMEDNIYSAGLGCLIGQRMLERGFKGKIFKIFSLPDKYIEHGSREELLKKYSLDAESIADEILKITQNES